MFHNAITLYSAYSKQYFKTKLPYNSQDSFSILHTYPYILPALILLNLLKPTGYVMHQQFNIQQLFALPTLYLCVLYLSQNKQRLVPLTA